MGGATHRPPILVRHDMGQKNMGQKNMGQKIKPADDPANPRSTARWRCRPPGSWIRSRRMTPCCVSDKQSAPATGKSR